MLFNILTQFVWVSSTLKFVAKENFLVLLLTSSALQLMCLTRLLAGSAVLDTVSLPGSILELHSHSIFGSSFQLFPS